MQSKLLKLPDSLKTRGMRAAQMLGIDFSSFIRIGLAEKIEAVEKLFEKSVKTPSKTA